ncbi:hypothetical protein BDN71DRAFT_1436066 [Pleurotus eryngii]|uniref:Uncharacterized protein n=1 Tax=Pleurotus eryngii TaxID=5323 RepID=A0A9P6DAD4_PLEER|nr:hypothetical protein BDN71DRAFT_1436066 [Pleurotus eryngii]
MAPKTTPVDPHATPRASRTRVTQTRTQTRTRNAQMQYPQASTPNLSPTRGSSAKYGPEFTNTKSPNDTNEEDSIVYKALLLELPQVPDSHSFAEGSTSSHSSRVPTKKELDVKHSGKQLDKVVACPGIMEKLIEKLRKSLKACDQLSENDPFMSRLSIESRCAHLPGNICSEHDTANWVHSVILRPAIAVVQYLLYNNTVTKDFPNISSVGGSAPVPDGVMFEFCRDADNALATIEFKTHVVLSVDWFDAIHGLLDRAGDSGIPGSAAKFCWPDSEDTEFDKATKVLVQVWGQMRKWKVTYAILSSYEQTYFLFKSKAQSDALYITNGFEPDNSDLLPATVSFLALALGIYSFSDLGLPEPNHL